VGKCGTRHSPPQTPLSKSTGDQPNLACVLLHGLLQLNQHTEASTVHAVCPWRRKLKVAWNG
jgi:hypothetical protein